MDDPAHPWYNSTGKMRGPRYTFGRSERMPDSKNQDPGPGAYLQEESTALIATSRSALTVPTPLCASR